MESTVVVRESCWRALVEHFAAPEERMAFAYGGAVFSEPDNIQYFIKEIDLPAATEYRFQRTHGVALQAAGAVARLTRARQYAAFLDAHSHPGAARPSPSFTDETGSGKQWESLQAFGPTPALLRFIFGASGVWAVHIRPGEMAFSTVDRIVVLGLERRQLVVPVNGRRNDTPRPTPYEARTRTLLGDRATAAVRKIRVGIVGCGGVGSAVARQLAGYVDEIALIDPDLVEASNAPRFYGYAAGDESHPKVAVLARELTRSFPALTLRPIRSAFPNPDSLAALRRSDVVFCCPDHNIVRYAVAREAARSMKPVVEVGCGGRGVGGRVQSLGYHVRLQVPDGPCLACNGMDLSSLEDPSSTEMKRRVGYVTGGDAIAGELIPLTTRAAADAVDLFFRYITGYAPVRRHVYFDALRMQSLDATGAYAPQATCTLCGDTTDSVWASGDREDQLLSPPQKSSRRSHL